MALTFLDYPGLKEFHERNKAAYAASLAVNSFKLSLVSKSGVVLSTIDLPKTEIPDSTSTAAGLMTAAQFNKLEGIKENANVVAKSSTNGNILIDGNQTVVYAHPTATAYDAGLYKVEVDATGHVISAAKVVKSDITDLGIPGQDTTYPLATASKDGLISSSDFSKLGTVAENAQVNVLESVKLNGTPLSISSKAVNIDLSGYALKSDISAAVNYRGQVDAYSDLPTTPTTGDMYNIVAADSTHGVKAGDNVIWSGSDWDVLSGLCEFDSISTAEIDALFT
jgi:phage antirepressor YoqD-like protein